MAGRKRKTSSFILSEVVARLRRVLPDEAYVAAGQRVVGDCLGVRDGERLLIVYEEELEELAAAIMMAADVAGATVDAVLVDADTPEATLMDRLQRRLSSCQVSVMLAAFTFPRSVRRMLTGMEGDRRHAHLLGITDPVVRQSLRVDYRDVDALGRRLVAAIPPGATLQVESPGGTRLTARTGRSLRWYNQGGLQHEPGWTNLPAGEVVTCPVAVDGVFVPDGGLWLTDGTLLDRASTRRLELRFEGGYLVRADGPSDVKTVLLEHLDEGREGRRVGQLSFGTNVGVIAPIGVASQDVKLPGFHLILGYSAPELTGASWNGDRLVQMLQRQATVAVDGRTLLSKGRYAPEISG